MTLIITIVVLVIALLIFFGIMGMYNGLVTLRNAVKTAFAQIDVQLQRRYDLIPNLVEIAKKYMQHERETLESVILARNAAAGAAKQVSADPTNPEAMKALMGAEQSLGGVLGRLFALSESYPDLKADRQMTQLMQELSSTEDKIAYSRQSYNDSVMAYNTKRELFPSSIIAGMFHFLQADLYKVDEESVRSAPKVEF